MRYVRVKVTAELKMAFRVHETDDEGDQQVSDQATRSKRKKASQKYRIEWELQLELVKGIKGKPYHAKCTVCPGKEIKIGDQGMKAFQFLLCCNMIVHKLTKKMRGTNAPHVPLASTCRQITLMRVRLRR